MNQPAAYTPLESLFLFQSLLTHGVDPGAFVRISELLKGNALIKAGDTYDAARLSPDALQHLFLLLLREELRNETDRGEGNDAVASPASRKRKIGSPPLPTLKDIYENVEKIPILIDRLYSRYREHIVKQIKDDERRFEDVQKHIQVLERSQNERIARAASQNGASPLAPRDIKSSQLPQNGSKPSPTPAHSTPTPAPRPPVTITPVPPPKPPISSAAAAAAATASKPGLPAHPHAGATPIRPSPSPQPPAATPSGLQAPVAVPPTNAPPRVLQSPVQPPRQSLTPRPEVKAKDATPTPQSSTPTPGAAPAPANLKWERQYKPLQAGQPPAVGHTPSPVLPKTATPQKTPQPQQPTKLQQPAPQPRPSQVPDVPSQPATPQSRASGKPVLVPPQGGSQLAPPLQPGPPRPLGAPPAQARPTSTTPIPPPNRPIQPQQAQTQPPAMQQAQRPIASASPTPSTGIAPPVAAPQRWTPAQQQTAAQVASPSPAAVPATKDKPYASPYIAPPSRPSVPEHIIRQAASTPMALKSRLVIPQTPFPASPASVTSGFGTKWASQSTPSTPRPLTIEPESPAFEPVSPPQRHVPLPRETPKPTPKKEKAVAKPLQKLEVSVPKHGRGRPPRSGQKARGESATPSFTGDRRSQSVASQTDELSLDTPIGVTKVKAEEATPRPREETGDTTADESLPGRSHMATPGTVARVLKRKRQDTPTEIPSPPAHVLWTRGFTKVSSSALDQISSHRDANMFATALRERDAPNYRQIVLQPQDITSIRSAIKQGNKAAVQAAASLTGGDPGTASVWLPLSEDLVPPRGIINSAQLERELVHMFCNAIMYNPDPYRGPGPLFMKSQEDQEEVVGYRLDENGVVKNTQSMFLEVEKLLGDLRSAEKERSAPPPSTTRPTSVATPADDTQDDEDELAGEPDSATGTVKRRRLTGRG